jgi:hypothetical protein
MFALFDASLGVTLIGCVAGADPRQGHAQEHELKSFKKEQDRT